MRHITIVWTVCFLIASPVLSRTGVAGSPRQIVLVPVYEQPSKDLDRLRDRLESRLAQQKNVAVIPTERVREFFFQGADTATPISKTAGDNVFLEAREYFYNGRFAEAKEIVNDAIAKLKEKPGIMGNLVRALLLKTQIVWELRDNDAALQATKEAVSYNFDADSLDPTENPSKLRDFYRKVHQQCVKECTIKEMLIRAAGKGDPIYVNGILRGTGTDVVIKFPEEVIQLVTAGTSVKAPVLRTTKEKVVVSGRNDPGAAASVVKQAIGFKLADMDALVEQARVLGKSVGTDQVILMTLDEMKLDFRMKLTVVDVKRGGYHTPKVFEFVDPNDDADKTVAMAAEYLGEGKVAEVIRVRERGTAGKKPIFKNPVFLGVLGALVVGGVTAGVLMMGGGGGGGDSGGTSADTSSSDSSTSSTSVSGPVPSF